MWNGATCSSPRSSTRSGQPVCASVLAVRVWQSVASCSRTPQCMGVDTACIAYMRPSRARELLACGLLEPRDKKLQITFTERTTVAGIPPLPEGYKFTEWMRCAAARRCVWRSVCVSDHHPHPIAIVASLRFECRCIYIANPPDRKFITRGKWCEAIPDLEIATGSGLVLSVEASHHCHPFSCLHPIITAMCDWNRIVAARHLVACIRSLPPCMTGIA